MNKLYTNLKNVHLSYQLEILFHIGCLIPPDDITSESAHYISKDDALSLTNFAIMDEDDEGDLSNDNQSDEDMNIPSSLSNHLFDKEYV